MRKFSVLKLPLFLEEAIFFGFAQFLGIFAANNIKSFIAVTPQKMIEKPSFSSLEFILYFLLGTLIIFSLLRFFKSAVPFRFFFFLAVFSGANLVLNAFFAENISLILSAALAIFLFLHPAIWLHNIVFTFGLAGLGALLGISLTPIAAIVILIILSVYDWIAVYKTKHMVKLAKEMIERGAIFALILPDKIKDMFLSHHEVKPGDGKAFFLGGGDVALPLLLSVSALNLGLNVSIFTAIFSIVGLFATHLFFVLQEKKKPMPALPPIAFFTILGFLLAKLII